MHIHSFNYSRLRNFPKKRKIKLKKYRNCLSIFCLSSIIENRGTEIGQIFLLKNFCPPFTPSSEKYKFVNINYSRPLSSKERSSIDLDQKHQGCTQIYRYRSVNVVQARCDRCNWLIFNDTRKATVRDPSYRRGLSWSRSKRRQTRGTCGGAWGEFQEADRVYARKPDELLTHGAYSASR